MEEFEWDESKRRANLVKHGIDFCDAVEIFDGPTVEGDDNRFDYGEDRVIAYGEMRGHVIAVVYTMRGDVCSVISARKAKRNERTAYYEAIAARPPEG